ncbi:MAG: glycoside hydrolase family 26 protein [Lachnospiraceae bacterium]|nr:glycoside hydrolase family 26 protein [Lachnospiraceae bacterium]
MNQAKTPCNKNATPEAVKLLAYLESISGKAVLLGQHTQTRNPKELRYIQDITGKQPAICGFELLAYSGNVRWDSCDEECLTELYEDLGTVENALDWGRKGGIVTFTWHWYSPVGGFDKSFYAEKTDFDPDSALVEGSAENRAVLRDLDLIAVQLKRFMDENIPVLWRPLHESDGTWFWWGRKGPEPAKKLFRYMYNYFTEVKGLNNLLWVWNSVIPEGYPGDDVVDIISRDTYPEAHKHTSQADDYQELIKITSARKLCALAEVGPMPDVNAIIGEQIPWCWYMTWSNDFGSTEEFTDRKQLYENYHSPYAVPFDKLPWNVK